jgi:7-cyano-7-deazaguanine synthase
MNKKKAVVLLSGGLDSATTLYYAKAKGYDIHALSFDYGQRHKKELSCARRLARSSRSRLQVIKFSLPWKGSSLIDETKRITQSRKNKTYIPNTYVPGRNIIFLSYALSYAESIKAAKIFIGANQIDYSGYPDCRQSFLDAFNRVASKGTKAGVTGHSIEIEAPLIRKTKADIVLQAVNLKVPIKYTWSCYRGLKVPCKQCDSCIIRRQGFKDAGIKDIATGL